MKLIINADDLGVSPTVNEAVLEGVQGGVITAASLMVNMPWAEAAAADLRKQAPQLSLALHFTLTSGKAMSLRDEIPLLVDHQGHFKHGFLGLWKNLSSRWVERRYAADFLEQIRMEFRTQLAAMDRLVRDYGLVFDHLDSHQHIHAIPGIMEICRQEAERRSLALRIPREPLGDTKRIVRRLFTWLPGGVVKRSILFYCCKRTQQKIGYFGILETGKVDNRAIREIARFLSKNDTDQEIFELNVHPSRRRSAEMDEREGRIQANSEDRKFHLSPWREKELTTLLAPEFRSLLDEKGIQLISFNTNDPQI